MMTFGKYGPKQGDWRRLGDIPATYLLWLSEQDFLYHNRPLAEYIENKFWPERVERRQQSASPRLRASAVNTSAEQRRADCQPLREFLATL